MRKDLTSGGFTDLRWTDRQGQQAEQWEHRQGQAAQQGNQTEQPGHEGGAAVGHERDRGCAAAE